MKKIVLHPWAIIKYSLFLALLIFLFVFFHNYFLFLFLLLFLLLPFFSILAGRRAWKRFSVSAKTSMEQGEKNTLFSVSLRMKNPGFLPLFQCRLEYAFWNLYDPGEKEGVIEINYLPGKTTVHTLPFSSPHAGCLRFKTGVLRSEDFLSLVTFAKETGEEQEIAIWPSRFSMEEEAEAIGGTGREEQQENPVKGNAFSEVMDVREYRPGDRMQMIHWKLSAKNQFGEEPSSGFENLIVKEFEQGTAKDCVLLTEICNPAEGVLDAVLDLVFSFGSFLLEQDKAFSLCWWSRREKKLVMAAVGSGLDFLTAINRMYYEEAYAEDRIAYEQYSNGRRSGGNLYYVCAGWANGVPQMEQIYGCGEKAGLFQSRPA